MLAALGHGADTLGGRGPVVPQLPPGLSQVGRLIGADQQPYRVAAVELRLDVRHDLDPVDHEIGDQAVDLSVLHDHADQPSSTQIALAELCAGEVLVVEASHADRLGRTAHATRDSAAGRADAPGPGGGSGPGCVGGQDVVRVPVEVLASPVVAHRGSWVCVAGRDLDVTQVHARIEHGGDEGNV
jgi:hypothetical protein